MPVSAADENADPNRLTEVSVMLRIEFAFDFAQLTPGAMRDLDQVAAGLVDFTVDPNRVRTARSSPAPTSASIDAIPRWNRWRRRQD